MCSTRSTSEGAGRPSVSPAAPSGTLARKPVHSAALAKPHKFPQGNSILRARLGCARGLQATLLCLLALTGCSRELAPPIGERRAGPPQRGGVFRTAFFTSVRTLDPAVGFTTTNAAVGGLLFDTLLTYDAEGELIPQLAERYQVSPDGLDYRFDLRRGVLMHDGSELSAEDVVRTFRRTLHPDTPSPASFYDRIEGFADYRGGKSTELGVRAEGKYRVHVRLSEPDSTFLHVLALQLVAPLCRSAGDRYTREAGNTACGAGPFKLARYEPDRTIELTRHEGYYVPGQPYLDAVHWQLLVQPFTQRYKLESGELDYVRELGRSDVTRLRADPRWAPLGEWSPPNTVFGSFMNTERPPFNDRHLRRAVAFAVNREHIAMIRPGQIVPQYKLVPDIVIPSEPGYPAQRHDLAQALEEMRLAGYPYDPATGEGGYPHPIDYLCLVDSFGQQVGELLQQQLAKIGLRLRLKLVGWPTYQALAGRRGGAVMGTTGWHPDFPEASNFFESTLTTGAIAEENSQNNAFFSNAELDQLMVRARGNPSGDERRALYRRAEAIVAEEAPWVMIHTQRYLEVSQPYVHGYRPHPILTQHVRGVWLDRSRKEQHACLVPGGARGCLAGALPASFGLHTRPRLGLRGPGAWRSR